MPSMYNIVRACEQKRIADQSQYKKIVTGGNDPSITQASKFSHYVNHSKPKTEYVNKELGPLGRLATEGITFTQTFSPILVSLQFTNLKTFNMPREKVFSRINIK
jgi:hypothetical protein